MLIPTATFSLQQNWGRELCLICWLIVTNQVSNKHQQNSTWLFPIHSSISRYNQVYEIVNSEDKDTKVLIVYMIGTSSCMITRQWWDDSIMTSQHTNKLLTNIIDNEHQKSCEVRFVVCNIGNFTLPVMPAVSDNA